MSLKMGTTATLSCSRKKELIAHGQLKYSLQYLSDHEYHLYIEMDENKRATTTLIC